MLLVGFDSAACSMAGDGAVVSLTAGRPAMDDEHMLAGCPPSG